MRVFYSTIIIHLLFSMWTTLEGQNRDVLVNAVSGALRSVGCRVQGCSVHVEYASSSAVSLAEVSVVAMATHTHTPLRLLLLVLMRPV